jgi:hypothetical protein
MGLWPIVSVVLGLAPRTHTRRTFVNARLKATRLDPRDKAGDDGLRVRSHD